MLTSSRRHRSRRFLDSRRIFGAAGWRVTKRGGARAIIIHEREGKSALEREGKRQLVVRDMREGDLASIEPGTWQLARPSVVSKSGGSYAFCELSTVQYRESSTR